MKYQQKHTKKSRQVFKVLPNIYWAILKVSSKVHFVFLNISTYSFPVLKLIFWLLISVTCNFDSGIYTAWILLIGFRLFWT